MKLFKNKKILVTGGAGFIGSHLVKKLLSLGSKISVIVKYNSFIDSPRLSKIWNNINIIEADLRNTDSVLLMKGLKFDYIFHLAAYNHVGDSFKHVTENINSNFLSTVNLINNGPKFKKFLHIGSSEIYGLQNKIPFSIKEKPNPQSPYGLTKFASEIFCLQKAKEHNLNAVCVRPFNTFGPYQSEKAIIPEIIIKCLLNREIKTTLGNQTREFNFVENIVNGLLTITQKCNFRDEQINLGTNNPIKIINLIKKIHKITNSKSKLKIGSLKYRPNEIWKMQADNKFIKNKLGWAPNITFDDGLKTTIDWYRKFLKLYQKDNLFIKLQ